MISTQFSHNSNTIPWWELLRGDEQKNTQSLSSNQSECTFNFIHFLVYT